MIEFKLNPPGTDEMFLECLNRSYNPWGSKDLYEWSFREGTDRILGTLDGKVAYGAALYHRRVLLGDGVRDACIIGDGWTLPEFRRKGLSTRGIEFGKDVCRRKGVKLMLSFVVNGRESRSNMVDNGFTMFPSRYFKSRSGGVAGYDLREVPAPVGDMMAMEDGAPNRFVYDEEGWKAQFLDRVPRSSVLSISGGKGYAVIEERAGQDSILSLVHDGTIQFGKAISSLMERARSRGRELFHYSTDPSVWEVLEGMGFIGIEGSVAVCDLGDLHPDGEWRVRNGDRM